MADGERRGAIRAVALLLAGIYAAVRSASRDRPGSVERLGRA